jgi:predicted transposase/invertase (TIGR01784 family)
MPLRPSAGSKRIAGMIPRIDPTVNYAFKRLFGTEGSEALAEALLNAVLRAKGGKAANGFRLLNPMSAVLREGEKLSIFDIRGRDFGGRQFNMEMQMVVPWSFDKRGTHYLAKLHASQMLEGDYYETLRESVAVYFLAQPHIPDDEWHHQIGLWDRDNDVLWCKDLEAHVIELAKFDVALEDVRTPLERWCYFLKHACEMDHEHLPPTMDSPEIRRAMEVLVTLGLNDPEYHAYLDQERARRDAATERLSKIHAHDEGFAKGEERGLAKGEILGKIELCQSLLGDPATPREELLKRPPEDLAALAKSLEERLRPRATP